VTSSRAARAWKVTLAFNGILALASLLVFVFLPRFRDHVVFVLVTMPSEFLVTFVQHEPIILYFAKYHSIHTVVALSILGTVAMEVVNYSSAATFTEFRWMQGLLSHTSVKKAKQAFGRAPFTVIVVAALTPVPFFPFRFLAPLSGYPLSRYILALSVGRIPRFYLLALLGEALHIRNDFLIGIFVVCLVLAVFEIWRSRKDVDTVEDLVEEAHVMLGESPDGPAA
jgi:membrane protein YqaA with SNARE-associated domain